MGGFACVLCKAPLKKQQKKFCSNSCRNKYDSIVYKGTNNPFYGKKHTQKTIDKISRNRKGKTAKENHPQWKGGISATKEYKSQMDKQYREKHKKELVLGQHRYYINNKARFRLHRKRRKALLKAGGVLTLRMIQQVYEDNIKKYGTLTCIYCQEPIQFGSDSLEHKTPVCRGGTNKYENLAIACICCNKRKNRKTVEEYRKEGAIWVV